MERLRIREVGLGLALTLGAVGCGKAYTAPETPQDSNGAVKHSVEVVEGRYYDCARYASSEAGGLDCNRISSDARPQPQHSEGVAISIEDFNGRKYDCFRYIGWGGLDCNPVS